MSVRTVPHYIVDCDGKCGASHLVGPVGSAYAARVEAGKDGWQFSAVKVLPDGQKVRRNRDLCPRCGVPEAEIVDDPDAPSEAT